MTKGIIEINGDTIYAWKIVNITHKSSLSRKEDESLYEVRFTSKENSYKFILRHKRKDGLISLHLKAMKRYEKLTRASR